MLVEGTQNVLSCEQLSEYLALTNRDERGVDAIELEMLVFLRDQCEAAAGLTKLVDALGLDLKFIREHMHMLRQEGLVQDRGKQGHALTPSGRAYLADRAS
jgi:predicted transcriptional regulator